MKWNWQQSNWPNFTYDSSCLAKLEEKFAQNSKIILAIEKYLDKSDKDFLKVTLVSEEALKSSEIEGEYLNRDSLQSSIRKHFGLSNDNRKISSAEYGISEMMMNLYNSFSDTLNHNKLCQWHKMLTNGRIDLGDIGRYRTHEDPMQIISGPIGKATVHFEAPASKDIFNLMENFIHWFNESSSKLSPLIRAGITHLYFISIHPFEDGNGRIVRALVEKTLAQHLKQPTLIALSKTIQHNKKAYYQALEKNNKNLDITNWLEYFAQTIIEAQDYTYNFIDFLIKKAKFYKDKKDLLNPRQTIVIQSLLEGGLEKLDLGLSAYNYIKTSGASRATATRDLQDLVNKELLIAKGELKYTRYYLKI